MLLLDIRDGVDNVSALEQELLDWGVKFMLVFHLFANSMIPMQLAMSLY